MNERIRELRKKLGLTLEKFGERLGVKKSVMSLIENDKSSVTDQMFKSICREFSVNPKWLENGTGDMFITNSAYDKAYHQFGYIMENAAPGKAAVLSVFLELLYTVPDHVWENIIEQYDDAIKKNKKGED